MAIIQIPDFQFSSHFYPEHVEDLIQFLRNNAPELTDEDPAEPHIQIIRAQGLSFHLNSVLLDLVANEMFLGTAKLRSSVRALLQLIGAQLKQAGPASADLLVQLTQTFNTQRVTIPAGAVFSTMETTAAQSVEFESLADADILARTDQVELVYAYDATANSYTDHTSEAQSIAGNFTPNWGAAMAAGDMLYIGHRGVLWNKTRFNIATAATGVTGAVWEYYDGNFNQGVPTAVVNLGSQLQFNVNSILGTASRDGTTVRVRSALTGAFQDLVVTFTGGENRITTSGDDAFLGQSSPSLISVDYIVGTAWRPLPDQVDATGLLTITGIRDLDYTLPQTLTANWRKTEIGVGGMAATAYWLRYRIISVSGPTAPQITQIGISDGKQFQILAVSQGRSREDDPLGSSDGSPDQEFTLQNFPVIDDTNLEVIVTEGGVDQVYTRVDNFLNSIATDRHYTVNFEDDGSGVITFGNGVSGRIPPGGVNNIKATYRTMDEVDGNVGAQTITVNRSGVAFVAAVTNPRAAAGFSVSEGSTPEDLARVKIAGPASLRTRGRAVTPDDAEQVVKNYVAADGSNPVKRALAIEESFGPKTIEIVVVGGGGSQVAADKLAEIEDYFNGTEDTPGILVMNNRATASNFVPKPIDVTATVFGGNETAILTALTVLLNPLAVEDDGSFVWDFGTEVPLSRLIQEVMNTSPKPRKVNFTVPAADTALATRELPTVGTINLTMVP